MFGFGMMRGMSAFRMPSSRHHKLFEIDHRQLMENDPRAVHMTGLQIVAHELVPDDQCVRMGDAIYCSPATMLKLLRAAGASFAEALDWLIEYRAERAKLELQAMYSRALAEIWDRTDERRWKR